MTETDRAVDHNVTTSDSHDRPGRRGRRVQASETRLGRRSQTECENDLLKRLVADLVLEKALLTERLREMQAQE